MRSPSEAGGRRADRNPFASRHIESLPYLPTAMGWPEIRARLDGMGGRGAVVGPKGSGKTTLLEAFGKRLSGEGYAVRLARLNRDRRRPGPGEIAALSAGLSGKCAVLLDRAEQPSWPVWMLLRFKVRRAGILLVTAHAPGRLPTLVETATSPELLKTLADRLLPPDRPLDPDHARHLFHAHGGDIRRAFRELYDIWARGAPGPSVRIDAHAPGPAGFGGFGPDRSPFSNAKGVTTK